ncbi:two-component sensor histidine kinase [Mycobacterium talmoniae]|uniref:histidine kinase n=2 Tax=Mycobacterium talmoniae TaxID=1858794 RepID=A0A1S1NHU8_9MYCO|nr:two-component sensor histidine kinase [Mycobacterium talmoniae]
MLGRFNPLQASVRTRSALAAAVVMTVCLALACGVLLLVLYLSLAYTGHTAAAARAERIATQLRTDAPRDLDPSLLVTDGQIGAVQVLDDSGKVLAASTGVSRRPVASLSLADGQVRRLRVKSAGVEYWVSARGVETPGGTVTVVVGVEREPVEAVVETVGILLAIGAPFIVALVAVATYRLVRAALRPVEAIRAQVASMSSTDLRQRVPVPRTRDEIAELARTMNAMLYRLERGRDTQLRLVSDASHELRSPLSTITTALELAAGRPDLIDTDLIDESLLPEARRMNQLIDDLLLLARSDEGALGLRHDDVDVDDLLLAEASRLAGLGAVAAVTDIQPCRTVGDRAALARVVRNLVDNAARHATSTVTLGCRPDSGQAVITVADDGPGIPAPDRARVFERFVRLDAARARASGGTGLGLSIVAQVVRSHHGTVTVGDADGGGALFTVTLPLQSEAGQVSDSSR